MVGAPSQADFRKRSAEIIGELAENGVEKNRIRTVFRKVKKDALEEFVELWIVPPATRRVPIADPTLHSAGKLPTLAGNIVRAVKPAYPPAARAVGAGGPVAVAVTLDEEGNVVAAKALSGHALLRSAAVKAAKETVYSPSIADGRPVGVTGVIVFNFVPPSPPQ